LSVSDHQISSRDFGSTRQFSVPLASPICVSDASSNSVCTAPVLASATRTHARLWSRELDTNARAEPSGYHSRSQMPVPQAM